MDYPSNLSEYTRFNGTWTVTIGGVLMDGNSTAEGLAYVTGNVAATDYSVEATVVLKKDNANPEGAIVFRLQNENNFYWAGLGIYGRRVGLGKKLAGASAEVPAVGKDGDLVFEVPYKLKVTVTGAHIQVYVNDVLEIDWTDPTSPLLNGTIGFRVWNSHSLFTIGSAPILNVSTVAPTGVDLNDGTSVEVFLSTVQGQQGVSIGFAPIIGYVLNAGTTYYVTISTPVSK